MSLFKLLSDAHPQAVAALETQVRPGAARGRAEGKAKRSDLAGPKPLLR